MTMVTMNDVYKVGGGLAVGAAVGTAVGMLFAPKAGRETREEIKAKANEVQEKAQEMIDTTKERAEEMYERGRDMIVEKRDALVGTREPTAAEMPERAKAVSGHTKTAPSRAAH